MTAGPESAPPPPGVLRRIAEIAGVDAARAIWREFGGRRLYIPMEAGEGTGLVECVGMPAARRIVEALGYGYIPAPAGQAGAYRSLFRELADEIDRLDRAGHSAAQIAARIGVAERTVRNHRRRRRAAEVSRQPGRFDG